LQAVIPFIDQILQGDRQAPRKRRHMAHRIWARLREERPDCSVAERTLREYVHERKLALGLLAREVCVAQSYDWGVEAQVDFSGHTGTGSIRPPQNAIVACDKVDYKYL
jgi:hypothetical protein